jgi:diacylglycerol kinase
MIDLTADEFSQIADDVKDRAAAARKAARG